MAERLAKDMHRASWWVGVIGALVLLLNRVLGLDLDAAQIASVAGVIASVVLGGHYVAGKAATSSSPSAHPASGGGQTP
jgi:hypothetical protein